jgi:hypothetical protein
MEYLAYLIFAVALRYAIFSHHTLAAYREKAVDALTNHALFHNIMLAGKLRELYGCPFCNGCWAGFFVSIVCLPPLHFITDVILFPIAVGYLSLLIEEKRKLDDERYMLIQQQRNCLDEQNIL